ncbi:MAG: ester cyclase [Acidimicrobiales bacterium]
MAAETANKELVRHFYEQVWNLGNTDVALDVFADDYVRHDLRPTESIPGGAGQARIAADFRAAFPDLVFVPELIVAEGDLVVARWTASGTHRGRWGTVEPTGKHVEFSGVNIFRVEGGKVVEIWNHRDDLGLLQQTGAQVFAGAAPLSQDD